jgi:hypothetical protein
MSGGGLAVRASYTLETGRGTRGQPVDALPALAAMHPIPSHPIHCPPSPVSLQVHRAVSLILANWRSRAVRRRSASTAGTLQEPAAFKFEQPNLDLLHMQAGREERSTKRRWQQSVSPSLAGELGHHFVPILPVRSSKSDSLLPALH